MNNIKEKFC